VRRRIYNWCWENGEECFRSAGQVLLQLFNSAHCESYCVNSES
jgi:hypothetical protein